jgi:uncharacterized protein
MKLVYNEDGAFLLCFDRGEEVVEGIAQFCGEQAIRAGVLWAIGSTQEVVVSWFDPDAKIYRDETLRGAWEIASLTGNVALLEGKPMLHAHGVFSDETSEARGGHVKRLVTGATCEVLLRAFRGEVHRERSEDVGLNLLAEK